MEPSIEESGRSALPFDMSRFNEQQQASLRKLGTPEASVIPGGPVVRGPRKRVVVAGLGETGVLSAVRLTDRFDVTCVTPRPGLVVGQELGWRLTNPLAWAGEFVVSYDRYNALDQARIIHGTMVGADLDARTVTVEASDGTVTELSYDALVVATGITNGFWRSAAVQNEADVVASLLEPHERLAAASSVIVVGGGISAVGSAYNIALTWPDKKVDLYFPGERALAGQAPGVWDFVLEKLAGAGVGVRPGHRAVPTEDGARGQLGSGVVHWSTGQPPASAEAVLWAVGATRPNTSWLPPEALDERGFVRVTPQMHVPGRPEVFAVGDVAATDPLRTSARNHGYEVLADNVCATLDGGELKAYEAPGLQWGAVLGAQHDPVEMFMPDGTVWHLPLEQRLTDLAELMRAHYRGIRPAEGDPLLGALARVGTSA